MDGRRATFFILCTNHIKAPLPRTNLYVCPLRKNAKKIKLEGHVTNAPALTRNNLPMYTQPPVMCQYKVVDSANPQSCSAFHCFPIQMADHHCSSLIACENLSRNVAGFSLPHFCQNSMPALLKRQPAPLSIHARGLITLNNPP
ncbi:hypothetical protein XENORESO_000771 [Xenotaenia resolanae]